MSFLTIRNSNGFAALGAAAALAWLGACNIGAVSDETLPPLRAEMAREPLAMSPITATAVGYHVHRPIVEPGATAPEINLDELLDDYSPAGIEKRINFYKDFDARMHSEETIADERDKVLKGDLWVDFGVMEDRVERALFQLERERPFTNDPNFYIELLGRALFVPLTLEYAPAEQRFGHIIARLERVPGFLDVAKQNLTRSSQLEIDTAKEESTGLVNLIQQDIPRSLPPGLNDRYEAAAAQATEALRDFRQFLDDMNGDEQWRMGGPLFEERVRVMTQAEVNLDSVLIQLQSDYDATYKQLIDVAIPIHRGIYGGARAPNDFALMRDILDVVSDENRLRDGDGLVARIQENVEDGKQFMQSEELVPFPNVALDIDWTPPFLWSKAPVDAFQAPPLLDVSKGAQLWITPIPPNWSRNQTLAKLREFNNYKLKIVAVDGYARYLQSVLSAEIPGEEIRLLRNVDPNRGFTAGWVRYFVDATMEMGYPNSNEFKLNWYKYRLEILASTILDIKLHTQDMSENEARDMLRTQVFMESGAVDSAVHRIQLSPADFTIAYVGANEWLRVRKVYQNTTTDFSYQSFNGKALRAGPLPARELVYVTTEGQGSL